MKRLSSIARRLLLFALFPALPATLFAAAGDLFEADFSSGIIYRFTPGGTRTVYASGFNGPEGLAFDTSGNLFLSETGTGIIYKFGTDGTQTIFASGLNGPASLVFDSAGNLFDADFFGGVIYKFAPNGSRTTFATGLNGPANLAFNSAGDLFEADFQTGTIFRFTPGGTKTIFASNVGRPHGLAFDSNGNLFVADFQGGTILRFTPAGARTSFASGLSGPHGINFDSSGNLFSADYNTGNIYRFAPNGSRTTFASGLSNPGNVLFEPSRASANNLLNLSTRALVGTQSGVLIGGFILQGSTPSTVIVRGIGPSLAASGVTDALEDPHLELFDSAGNPVTANDNWQTGPDAAPIQRTGLAPGNSKEAAFRTTLSAGAYTVVLKGVGDATQVGGSQPGLTGIGLVEIYDLQQTSGRAGNIATRGTVLSGDNVMIAGSIVGGSQNKEVLVRAIGPSLKDLGVNDALENPVLELFNGNGTSIATNDDWQQGPDAATIESRGFAPGSPLEAALLVTVPPGSFTAIERPSPQDSGVGLIEIYDMTPAPGAR
ncbi:MAG TPA: NHL repeat-containing protein [Chthoniobacterales bacterium]|jgi:sugar lactone lactonase YvrE|nr:NHL repeat-containing protein [Chthoniobacterales bacterium]